MGIGLATINPFRSDKMVILAILVIVVLAYFYFKSKTETASESDRSGARPKSTGRVSPKGRKANVSPDNGFVVFDLETTGLHAGRNKIIEIAAIKVSSLTSKDHATLEHLIKIKGKVPEKIVEITSITDEILKDGVDIKTVIAEFKEFCGNLPLVAYNAEFDKGFLKKAAEEIGWEINNEFHCALLMAKSAFPNHRSYKLTALANHANIEVKGAHRALADCVMAVQVYSAAYQKLGRAIAV